MHIASAVVSMSAEHQLVSNRRISPSKVDNPVPSVTFLADAVGVNDDPAEKFGSTVWLDDELILDARTRVNKLVLEGFLGLHLINSPSGVSVKTLNAGEYLAGELPQLPPGGVLASEISVPDSVDLFNTEFQLNIDEKELSKVSIAAVLNLADGTEYELGFERVMSRQLNIERIATNDDISRFMDPLVLNFSGSAALSEWRVDFDLNGDGRMQSIPQFKSNSAYLALDLNGDGRVGDGSELFGVASGNGFSDLARYDSDNNGFIDESDPIFRQLLLFRPGFERLTALTDTAVEAIYLGYVESPFSLTSVDGDALGLVRSTGFYIETSAQGLKTGSIQQIDLAV